MLPKGKLPTTDANSFRIGKYELIAHLATGGMGSVFRAKDSELGREVALKVLQLALTNREDIIERFRREARHCARLRHEGIVTVYDYGEDGDYLFLAMELVEGTNLFDFMVRNGSFSPELALKLMGHVVKALDHAHQQSIIHRDIKPSNILITNANTRPKAKLIDFGLALLTAEEESRVTRDGSTVGTVDYMPPEQAQDSRAVDIRSDIYSLGCTFYHLLAGRPPFPEGSIHERLQQHAEAEPLDIRELAPQVPRWLAGVLHRMLAKKPNDRFQTPAELYEALRQKKTSFKFPGEDKPVKKNPASPGGDAPTVITPTREPEPKPVPEPSQPAVEPDSSGLPFTPTEIHQVAGRQFERASQVLAQGNHAYALPLLLACCKQEPRSLLYRQTLRQVQRELCPDSWKPRWLGSIRTGMLRWKFNRARNAEEYKQVLELGETLLTANPYSVSVHLSMAEAAEELGMPDVARWILEDSRSFGDVRVYRALAEFLERENEYKQAVTAWEEVLRLAPADAEAANKIKNLTVNDTIARGGYKERFSRRSRYAEDD